MHAFVLALRKHTDRAQILTLYTLERGRMDVFVYGAGGKRHALGLYRPMQEIQLEIDEHPNKPATLKEASLVSALSDSPEQQMVALTIAEVVYRTILEPLTDEAVYRLLQNTTKDMTIQTIPAFLTAFSHVLGYGGNLLPEWQNLTSLSMYRELIF